MPVISSDIFRLAVVKQTGNPPTTPASPAFMTARLTSESINFQPNVTTSNELDPSGQPRESILVGAQTTGAVEGELSKHTYIEDALAAAFRNAWGTGNKGNGAEPYTPVAVSADELIPATTISSYLLEKRFTDPAGDFLYHRFGLSAVSSFNISISPGQPILTSVEYSGGPMTLAEEIISGATYADPGVNPVFTAHEVIEINVGTVPMTLCFSSLSMTFNSNVRGIECIGTLGFREQVLGRFEPVLEGTAYFVSNELLQYLVDQTVLPVTVTLEDSLGNQYEFFFPRCKMTAANANASGTNQDVIANVSLQALFDPLWNFSCKVTRVAA